jgi:hypothetical protein
MKHIFYTAILFLSFISAFSQAPFWNESFGTGCNQGQFANGLNASGLGVWTTSLTGVNQASANNWFISATEAGMGVNVCGDGCLGAGGINRTLHVSVNIGAPFTDTGAAYAAGAGGNTDIRAESPVINCTGQSTITLSFLYLAKGVVGSDYFEVQYYNGATWSVISTPPPTPPICPGGQGLWTSYTVALPASANNNPNVKIGFRWQNVDPTGADPSVAIDDVKLTTAGPPPAFAATFTIASPQCSGNTTTVTANTGTAVASGYTWTSLPAGPVFGTPNASATSITFPSAGTFSISLAATSGTNNANNTQTVLVNASPAITANASSTSICAGQSSTLTAAGGSTYTWNPGAVTGSNVVVSPTVTITYTVIGTSAAGCTASAVKTISVNAAPNLTLSASPSAICSGLSSTLTAAGANTYSWNPGALTGSSVVVSPTVTTNYTVIASSAGGCTATAVQGVTVGASLSISLAASPATICIGSSSTLTATGATSYSWNPGALTGSVNVVTPSVTTVYTVTGATGACTGIKMISVGAFTCSTDLNSLSLNNSVYTIYPNPTSDKLFIQAKNNAAADVSIEIIDALGKTVLKQSHNFNPTDNTRAVNVNVLPSGIYFVKITSQKDTKVLRFIKE